MRVKRVWVTEKPEMARNLAAGIGLALGVSVVNAKSAREDGGLRLSNGDIVTHCFGHMIQPVPPSLYLGPEDAKKGRAEYFSFLPIRPPGMRFRYEPKPDRLKDGKPRVDKDGRPVPPAQYFKLVELLKAADDIVNAGDIDREGQRIVDELLEHVGIDPAGRDKPIWRLPLVSARDEDIRKQVLELAERNGDAKWRLRGEVGLARQLIDWDLGMNLSMAYQCVTNYARMSLGRLQTPVLALVVERELAIRNFKPRNYYVPVVTLSDGTQMRWHRRDGAENTPGFDEEGRIIDEQVAKRICSLISAGMTGTVKTSESEKKEQAPPLPFSASVLTSTVAKRFGHDLKEAQEAAQKLYERHKAISYVGTDCRFIPTSMLADARATLENLSRLFPREAQGANLKLVSKAWNDSKVDEHFAIVPTGKLPEGATPVERAVYETVAKRYMAQFYPNHQFVKNTLGVLFGNDEFRAHNRQITRMGWKDVEGEQVQEGEAESDEDLDTASEAQGGREVTKETQR